MGKLQNIKAVKEMMAGTHKTQQKRVYGFTSKQEIAEEDIIEQFEDGKPKVWIETINGTRWKVEQHDGFRSKKPENSILDSINEILKVPMNCPKCDSQMKGTDEEKLNLKFWFKSKHCFSCQVKEETIIRSKGKDVWEEYCRGKMLNNAESWFKDVDQEVQILRESLKLQFVQNADGELAEYDQSAFFNKFDSDYNNFKTAMIEKLSKEENGK